jgi:hypothetical protein
MEAGWATWTRLVILLMTKKITQRPSGDDHVTRRNCRILFFFTTRLGQAYRQGRKNCSMDVSKLITTNLVPLVLGSSLRIL